MAGHRAFRVRPFACFSLRGRTQKRDRRLELCGRCPTVHLSCYRRQQAPYHRRVAYLSEWPRPSRHLGALHLVLAQKRRRPHGPKILLRQRARPSKFCLRLFNFRIGHGRISYHADLFWGRCGAQP